MQRSKSIGISLPVSVFPHASLPPFTPMIQDPLRSEFRLSRLVLSPLRPYAWKSATASFRYYYSLDFLHYFASSVIRTDLSAANENVVDWDMD